MITNNKGMSLVEIMVVVGILSLLGGGIFMTMTAGRRAWSDTDIQMQLQESLRLTFQKVSRELRESGVDSGAVLQVTIGDGAGVGSTDTLIFSMPVICQAGGSVTDSNGDVANWGAPLTWGCTNSTCMDADNDCATVDYKFVDYRIDGNNQLLRRVLDGTNTVVKSDVFAQNVSDFQAALSANQKAVVLTIAVTGVSDTQRQLSATGSQTVYLRNGG